MHPNASYETQWQDRTVRFDLYLASSFRDVHGGRQVYAFVFDAKNRLLIVSSGAGKWTLPGGTVERSETYRETLKREVYEEAAIVVDAKNARPFYYQRVFERTGTGKWTKGATQLRYTCRMKRRDKFVSDPGGHTKYQKFVLLSKLRTYLKWGKTTDFILKNIAKAMPPTI